MSEQQIIEQRTVCSECGQQFGLFHKGCDGHWVRQRRAVTKWRTIDCTCAVGATGVRVTLSRLTGDGPHDTDCPSRTT